MTRWVKGIVRAAALFVFVLAPAHTASAGLADLVVADAVLNDECKLDITIANMGDGLPLGKSFHVRIQASKDGKGAGGWLMPVKNKNGELSSQGGRLMFHFFPLTIQGTVTVQIDVDHFRKIVESNDDNNRMLRTFTCGAGEPAPPKKLRKRRLRRKYDRRMIVR